MKKKNHLLQGNQAGFTLVEIITVLVILGILAAIAAPKYSQLQNEARSKAADAAIAEAKSRLSNGYGQFLLANSGVAPADILAICTLVNDDAILPISAAGSIPMGDDYSVTLASTGVITVTQVQGVMLSPARISTWEIP